MAIAYRSVLGTGGGDAAIVKSLTVTQQPTKTVYLEGEPLDLTGLRVSAVVEPFSGEVTNYVTTTPANEQPVPSGISDILVKYGNAITSIPITVHAIDEIEITTQPTTEYFVGDTLDLTGIVVTGYANNKTMSTDITKLCTFSPSTLSTAGTQTITVTYKNFTTTLSVGVYVADTLTVTTMPTVTFYELNEPLDLTGIVITASTSDTSLSKIVTSQCTFSPANGTILNEEKTYNIVVSYNGLTTSFDVECKYLVWDNRGLDYNSWGMIQGYTKKGTLSSLVSVGETKSFTMNGRTYNAEVVAINDGTGSAASWYPDRTADFICTELYETPYQYNSTNTSAGGFPSSELRGTLVNTIYPLLPSDLKDVIIEKSHSYNIDTSGTMATDSTKLWFPTHYEIGRYSYAAGETASNNKAYTLASIIKNRNEQTSADIWWLGSIGDYNAFCVVDSVGDLRWTNYASDNGGVPICFRIG